MDKADQPDIQHHLTVDEAPETLSGIPSQVWVDLLERCASGAHPGPQWACESEDLNVTLISWGQGRGVEDHLNLEVDVLLVGVEGTGSVVIDGAAHELQASVLLLIPKGCERSIESTSPRFSYLSLHKRRRGLMPLPNW